MLAPLLQYSSDDQVGLKHGAPSTENGMAIISSGIGSGIDINSLVTDLVAAQREPQIQRLDLREARLQARLSGYGSLQGALAGLQQAVSTLTTGGVFAARSASVTDAAVASVSASSGATPGAHEVAFEALASAHRLVTDPALEGARFEAPSDTVGTGTLTIRFGTTDYNPETGVYAGFAADDGREAITIEITDGSLAGIRDAINAAGAGVRASIVHDGSHYRLSIAAAETGAANSLEITVADDDGNASDAAGLSILAFNQSAAHLAQTAAARDVQGLTIDGIAMTSPSNTVSGAIEGVEVTLLAPGITGIEVRADDARTVSAIRDFVDRYNALVGTINRLSSFDAETGAAGELLGDHVLRAVESRVRGVLSELEGAPGAAFRHLSQIGITHAVEDGTLVLDEATLNAAIARDRDAVTALFRGPADAVAADEGGVRGYAGRLSETLAGLLATGGIFSAATDRISTGIQDIARQREQVELRSLSYERRMRAQFNAMDALVAQLRSSSDFLMQQLEALPPIGRRDR